MPNTPPGSLSPLHAAAEAIPLWSRAAAAGTAGNGSAGNATPGNGSAGNATAAEGAASPFGLPAPSSAHSRPSALAFPGAESKLGCP